MAGLALANFFFGSDSKNAGKLGNPMPAMALANLEP
jgi:hypothetical protein